MYCLEKNKTALSAAKTIVLIIIVLSAFPFVLKSQEEDTLVTQSTRQEVWPKLDVYYRFNEKFRLFTYVSGTRLKSSSFTDGALSVNLDYFGLPVWRHIKSKSDSARGNLLWIRAGFLYSRSPSDDPSPVNEYTLVTEANIRVYLPFGFLLVPKNRVDWRFVNGNFKPRYRGKLQLEKDLSTAYLSFNVYANAEYFVNINSESHNRTRFELGSELKVTKHINFEVYIVHQFDNGLGVPTVNAVGFTLKFFWHKGDPLFGKRPDK